MKTTAIALSVLVASTGIAAATPGFKHGQYRHVGKHHSVGKLTYFERLRIARSRARLARLQRWIRADGRVMQRERFRLMKAKRHHRQLVRRERHD